MGFFSDLFRAIRRAFGDARAQTENAVKATFKPILCDRCKYNYGNVCVRPDRPNATECPDYKAR